MIWKVLFDPEWICNTQYTIKNKINTKYNKQINGKTEKRTFLIEQVPWIFKDSFTICYLKHLGENVLTLFLNTKT